MSNTLSNDEILETLDIMRPFYSECEMKVLTAFLDKIMALENKQKKPEPDMKALSALDALIKSGNIPPKKLSTPIACINSTDYAYTIAFNHNKREWLAVAHIGDGETVATAEGVTEIDAFWSLMVKL